MISTTFRTQLVATIALAGMAGALHAQPVLLDDFEWATNDAAAIAGNTFDQLEGATGSLVSGSGADASGGDHSLGYQIVYPAKDPGTQRAYVRTTRRTVPEGFTAVTLPKTYTFGLAEGEDDRIEDLELHIDVKGDTGFVEPSTVNIRVMVYAQDGTRFMFEQILAEAITSDTYTTDVVLPFHSRESGTGTTLSGVNGHRLLFIETSRSAMEGTIYIDNLRIVEPEPDDSILGDITGDGIVNVADVTALANAIVADETEQLDPEVADINDDGEIDFDDVAALADMIVNPAP